MSDPSQVLPPEQLDAMAQVLFDNRYHDKLIFGRVRPFDSPLAFRERNQCRDDIDALHAYGMLHPDPPPPDPQRPPARPARNGPVCRRQRRNAALAAASATSLLYAALALARAWRRRTHTR